MISRWFRNMIRIGWFRKGAKVAYVVLFSRFKSISLIQKLLGGKNNSMDCIFLYYWWVHDHDVWNNLHCRYYKMNSYSDLITISLFWLYFRLGWHLHLFTNLHFQNTAHSTLQMIDCQRQIITTPSARSLNLFIFIQSGLFTELRSSEVNIHD